MAQLSLSCDSFKNNIFNGLSSLQQNGEFVDMTLAADGHFVKVHQMIVSLASPYLKNLIRSAPCPHPVIFLNDISYPILCHILEYIYTGESIVDKENLSDLIKAGKALHIRGLQDMILQEGSTSSEDYILPTQDSTIIHESKPYLSNTISQEDQDQDVKITSNNDSHISDDDIPETYIEYGDITDNNDDDPTSSEKIRSKRKRKVDDSITLSLLPPGKTTKKTKTSGSESKTQTLQYALSNQGSLQLILNRFVYCSRYTYKNQTPPLRLWRCIDYNTCRCSASVTTKGDMVVHRSAAHIHPFHDKHIVKKMKAGVVFSTIKDAEMQEKHKNNKSEKDAKENNSKKTTSDE